MSEQVAERLRSDNRKRKEDEKLWWVQTWLRKLSLSLFP